MNLKQFWPQVCIIAVFSISFTTSAHANPSEPYSLQCIEKQISLSPPSMTLESLKAKCAKTPAPLGQQSEPRAEPDENTAQEDSLIFTKIQRERAAANSRYSLTGHKRNYILPVTHMKNTNEVPTFVAAPPGSEIADLDHLEAKFQVSLKTILFDNILNKHDTLYFGFTGTSFWQVYNKDVSSPFRETNYEPELFWAAPFNWRPWGTDATLLVLGFSHQSNGQSGTLSRSWNRLYTNFVWEKEDFVFSFKPWYRLPEETPAYPADPRGDDNPDIEGFMGHFEFTTGYRSGNHEVTAMFRNNLRSKNRGAIKVEWTFPLFRNIRGYAQYFNGYGESLIDYNTYTERVGIGFLLTDLL